MSSTPTTTLVPEDAAVSDSITPRSNCTVSVTPDGAHPVKAPRGMARAEDVPTVQRVSHPFDAAADNASRAIRVFPTPSAPQRRMPGTSEAEIAASMVRISSERPINGQDKRTYKSLRAPLALRGDYGDFARSYRSRSVTLDDLEDLFAQAVGGGLDAALHRAFEDEAGHRHGQVDRDVELHPGLVALGRERVPGVLGFQLTGRDQRPRDVVVRPGVLDHLLVGQASGLDRHLDPLGPAVVVALEDLGLLVLRRPAGCRLDV